MTARMPLIGNVFPPLELVREQSDSKNLNSKPDENYEHEYNDFQDEREDERIDGSILSSSRPKSEIPAIPPRSSLRASRLLESFMIELEAPEEATAGDESSRQSVESDPHASYLSSEEEASESADDYDESIVELDGNRPTSRASSQDSQEDTARMVSFMFVGKPQLVDVSHSRPNSLKRRSTDCSDKSRRRPSPLRLTSNDSRSSTPSSVRSETYPASTAHLIRQHTNPATLNSSLNLSSRHAFLQSDPFPTLSPQEVQVPPSVDTRPKTPTAIASAAWKKGVTRTLSLAKRKPSIPKLSLAYNTLPDPPQASLPPWTASIATPVSAVTPRHVASPATPRESQDQGPVNYSDIMRNVIKAPPPQAPVSANLKTRTSSVLLNLARRKSLRAG